MSRHPAKRIALAVVGLGEQSKWMFNNFSKIRKYLAERGIAIDLKSIADIQQKAIDDKKARYARLLSNVSSYPSNAPMEAVVGEFVRYLDLRRDYLACLVYDASATGAHFRNLRQLVAIQRNNLDYLFCYYFGEKPIVPLDHEYSDLLAESLEELVPHWCNFTELRNPAVLAVRRYIRHNKLKIINLRFWRLGDIGFKQLLHRERLGVTGGCFLDKAIHDLAVSYGFLSDSYKDFAPRFGSVQPSLGGLTVNVEWLMPGRLSPGPEDKGEFISTRGTLSTSQQEDPSDARTTATFSLHNVACEYTSGWLGLSEEDMTTLKDLTADFQQDPSTWLEESVVLPDDLKIGYRRQEARLLHVVAKDQAERRIEICANMLSTTHRGDEENELLAWAKVRQGRYIRRLRLPNNATGDAFSDIVASVASDIVQIAGNKRGQHLRAEDLGSSMSVGVHRLADYLATAIRQYIREHPKRNDLLEAARQKVVSQAILPYCFTQFNER